MSDDIIRAAWLGSVPVTSPSEAFMWAQLHDEHYKQLLVDIREIVREELRTMLDGSQ